MEKAFEIWEETKDKRSAQLIFCDLSTPKGDGTFNVYEDIRDKLIALHHLDVPWRPSDIEQQEGRILRQGNTNPKVKIFRYVTEGTFDAYSWVRREVA